MSFVLHRIRRALADPVKEPLTHALLAALWAHWKSLHDSNPEKFAGLREHLVPMEVQLQEAQEADEQHIGYKLALWEAKRAAFHLDVTLGGAPGATGPLQSSDWGTHWILFHWQPPETGALTWGYRVERSPDNQVFYPVEICVEPEVALLNQPQGQKFYYRVTAFNGFGDGPASPVFGIMFDPGLVDRRTGEAPPADGGIE
jgi:hypothetical protein